MKHREVFGLQKLKEENQILKQAIDKVKERCIEAEVKNKLLAKKNRLYGNGVMGYKVRENSDDDCPYYTMKETKFVDDVRSIQKNKSIAKIRKQTSSSTTAIMITLFCLALFFCIRKHLYSKKNRKIIERMNASAKNEPE